MARKNDWSEFREIRDYFFLKFEEFPLDEMEISIITLENCEGV